MSNSTAELVRTLIRNKCINDGTPVSGYESRNADVLETLFTESKIDSIQRVSKIEGRDSLVIRVKGRNPNAPKVLLLPHTDVVPAQESDWSFDPFSGEICDGFVYGRGAVDMFNVTASMAVALSELTIEGFAPEGDVTYIAVADEENGGINGAEFLYHEYPEIVGADYVLGETGGIQMPVGDDIYIPVATGEKGVHWIEIEVTGTPTHGSKPYGSDNAVLTSLRIIESLMSYQSPVEFSRSWTDFLEALGLDKELLTKLSSEVDFDEALNSVAHPWDSLLHACTHHTISPNIFHGGVKINIVPDHVTLGLDVRSLPGTDLFDIEKIISELTAPFEDKISHIRYLQHHVGTRSPVDTPLWDLLQTVTGNHIHGAKLIEIDAPYGTDLRFGRNRQLEKKQDRKTVGYGAALFDDSVTLAQQMSMFHGIDEKISVESLRLTTELYRDLLRGIEQGL